jgi:Gpi18-like mannosyltransferase
MKQFFQQAKWAIGSCVSSRIIIFATILLSRIVLVPGPTGHPLGKEAHGTLLSVLNAWDGTWYRIIAQVGYLSHHLLWNEVPLALAFFPFYPALIRLVAFVIPDFWLASVVVSNICFLVSAVLFDALIKVDYPDPRVGRRAITFLMFSPMSFFFSMTYSESTFLMLSLAAFLAARKEKWLIASLCGMCLSATRPPGFLIALPLFIEYLQQWRKSEPGAKAFFRPQLFLLGLIPLGLVAFAAFCYFELGSFFAFMRAHQTGWEQKFMSPWIALTGLHQFGLFYRRLFVAALAMGGFLFAAGFWVKIRPSYLVWTAVLVAFSLSWGTMASSPRYLSIIFPLFIVLGLLTTRFEGAYEWVLAASVTLLTLCTVMIANGYWMT